MSILNFCKNMTNTTFNDISTYDKVLLKKVSEYCLKNKVGHMLRAEYILDNFYNQLGYLCMFGLGCKKIQKFPSMKWKEHEYKTMTECLGKCSIPEHLLDEIVMKLKGKDKVNYFNSNPHYVDEQIRIKNWPPIMLEYVYFREKSMFIKVPEMISTFELTHKEKLEFYKKLINLQSLSISGVFNQSIILPEGLKSLSISGVFNQTIKLPQGFNQAIILPEGLKCLSISGVFNQAIKLPQGLELLYISGVFNQSIILPERLKCLSISGVFNQAIKLPQGLKLLYIYGVFNQPINLPQGLKSFQIGGKFNQSIKLPQRLEYFHTAGNFNKPIKLPDGLKLLSIFGNFNQNIILPEGLKCLGIFNIFNQPIILPEGLQYFATNGDYTLILHQGLQNFDMVWWLNMLNKLNQDIKQF